ncbi:probable disease resistance protein At1g15890 isoform X2 [Rhododendron vialii]|uniref:probable disease resistance protein At1g15890 isoform X2 n=1 Tax=Rhododendron vialii TaxID=182163 RepID=UPI00265E6653|nr:probable disease resistance protein At1g15890 isoform X2 [Rhododendron vialii]
MCFLEGIIELSVCKAFDEAAKAGKYVCQYRMHLSNLETEWRSLQYLRGTIERRVHGARDRGEEIEDAVSRWQEDAGRMENEVQQLIGQVEARMHCFACSCPNIKWRYQLGKQAEEKTAAVNQLTTQGSRFDVVSHPRPPPPELEFPSAENYVHLDSRKPIFEAIVNALKDPEVKMIGVHGPGGVGKTTLVEKVAKNMLDDGTFKQVPLVAVSKDLNVKEIQKKVADRLNFALDATKDEKGRANELWHKFKNGEKYLVILDDIWEKVDLKAIGIPVMEGNIGCKVVLTSRKEDLLRITMKVDRNFPIAELPDAEAWGLFKTKVGKTIESRPEIYFLARQVCRKCKGLPVAINALGAALEDRPYLTWKNALDKLERHMLTQIEGIDPSVWASLWVTYDMLRSSDAQSCFLLCCLFVEDAEISIDELMRHCMARSLLAQNPRTFHEARTAMHTVVGVLKSASLLSTDDHETVVKIHDVIRDVGISIAREKKGFLVDHGALHWPRNPTNGLSYKAMSLSFQSIKGLPDGLVYPQLETLMVDNSELSDLEVPDNFFNGMMQLTVLTFTRMRMRRLPSSLEKLTNLRMIYLNECELDDIAILKELKSNLEVLSLRGSSIEALPLEIGQLTGLRVLDLQNCDKLKMIPGGVISNLTSLEELYFPQNFDKWEATTDKQQDTSNRENVSLEELRRSLSIGKLTTLHIFIPYVMLLPKEDLIFGNLKGFKISVGNKFKPWEKFSGRCTLKLERIDQLRNEFIPLVDKAEVVVLSEIEGLKKVFHDRGVGNRFLDLKYLKVTSCVEDLEYLLGESKLSVQNHGLHRLQPFNNLTVLIIENCKSKYLFSPTTVKGLVHLEELEVRSCKIMEAIVGFERRNDEDELTSEVKFSKLKQLKLEDLSNLLSFYAQKEKMGTIMGSSSSCAQPLFIEKVIFPALERLTITELGNIIKIWDKQSIAVLEEQWSFYQLTDLEVKRCSKLMHVFPSNMHPLLKNLKKLEVKDCETMKGIAEFEGEIDEDGLRNEVASPAREHLDLVGVTEIQDKQSLPKPIKEVESLCRLVDIRIKKCDQLLYVFPSHMLPLNLQELEIEDCDELEVIFSKDPKEEIEAINDDVIVFPQLKRMRRLWNLPKLKSFYTETQGFFSHKVAFPVLEHLHFLNLDKITRIWDNQPLSEPEKEAKSFSELKDIIVDGCNQLEYVLPFYMLPQLKNLQELRVWGCRKMEVIISNNPKEKEATNNNDTIRFPQLKTLQLGLLPNLKSFICSETQFLFSNKVAFPVLQSLYFRILDKITRIWDNQPFSESEKEAKSFGQLMEIFVDGCNQLEYVLPFYMLPQLKNLQKLTIWNCTEMEVIISKKPKEKEATNNNDTIRFPQLKTVLFWDLSNLKSFICSETQLFFSDKDAFPVLEEITLYPPGTLEFLRNQTSTKEISMEECGTSGKESDHNGQEFDEDLKTPTKEECSTSGKENDHTG